MLSLSGLIVLKILMKGMRSEHRFFCSTDEAAFLKHHILLLKLKKQGGKTNGKEKDKR
jgi:hypothetical protein